MSDPKGEDLKVGFDRNIQLEFHGAKVRSDAGLLAHRYPDEALALFDNIPYLLRGSRAGRKIQQLQY